MKKLFGLLMFLATVFMVQSLMAQSGAQVTGLKPDEVWGVVQKVAKDNDLIINYSKTPDFVMTDFREYSAGLLKNRARLVFTYQDGTLTVSLKERQTLNNNGWADAVFPSKKADDKLCAEFAGKIRAVASNPGEASTVSTPEKTNAPATMSSALLGGSTGILKAANNSVAKKPSLANAKELRFDDGDNYTFRDGACALKKNELWGFIDTTGKVIADFKYFSWSGVDNPKFSSGIALVSVQEPAGYGRMPIFIDKNGQQLFKNQKFTGATNFESGIAIVEKTNEKTRARSYHIINKQGLDVPGAINFGAVFGGFSLKLEPFHEGLTKLYDSKTSSYGFINPQGKWAVMPTNYAEAGYFSEGLTMVQNKTNWYWGFINAKGEVKIPFDYKNRPGKFSEGLAAVENSKEKVGFIDKEGKTVLPFNYTFVFPVDAAGNKTGFFKNGYAVVYIEESPWGGYAIIDRSGKVIRKMGPEAVRIFDNGWIYWKETKDTFCWGIISPEGNDILVPGYFKEIGEFSNGLAYATANIDDKEVKGFINLNFDFVIVQTY